MNYHIRQFAEAEYKRIHDGYIDNYPLQTDWTKIFTEKGYVYADLLDTKNLYAARLWCQKEFGKDHFFIISNTNRFWFETEQQRLYFILKWF